MGVYRAWNKEIDSGTIYLISYWPVLKREGKFAKREKNGDKMLCQSFNFAQ